MYKIIYIQSELEEDRMKEEVSRVLYQKKGIVISNMAMSLLSRNEGDQLPSISEYEREFGVSRGTVQNALNYLKDVGAVELVSRGHMGTYISKIDYIKLQNCSLLQEMQGIMSLPYSRTYEGFATALYEQMEKYRFNMAYARGAYGRIRLVETGTYQFSVCSQYAAEHAIESGRKIEIVLNFGIGSFLSRHVLLLRDKNKNGIEDGMRVAYDPQSLDQSGITQKLIENKKVRLIDIRTQQTFSALVEGTIDAGVWNYDDIIENQNPEAVHMVDLEDNTYNSKFSTAVIIVRKGNTYMKEFLQKNISVEYTLRIIQEVRELKRKPFY